MRKYLFSLMALLVLCQSCATENYLKTSHALLIKAMPEKIVKYSFEEQYNTLGHDLEPWKATTNKVKGDFWVNANTFLKQDTLTNSRGRTYASKINYSNADLLLLDYGDNELSSITKERYFEEIINTARYTSSIVLEYFIEHRADVTYETSSTHAVYSTQIGKFKTKLFINTANYLIDKISYLSYHELYGDVTTTFVYSSYTTSEGLTYPTSIQIEKIDGNVIDIVKILSMEITSDNVKLLDKPENYSLIPEKEQDKPRLLVSKYNDFIHFIDLFHTDDRVMVVELDDYILVAEAPLNAKNGELIISEVKKIAPLKPIKYFVFGHHHPHYLGGLRAFVHNESIIICTEISKNYVEYIANAPHSMQPDRLHLNPKEIKTLVVSDSLVLGGNQEMKIYFMGEKSAHTTDYLIYYFPDEKLLFQDDLCWIPKEGEIGKARKRQAGLYQIIKELNIEVETIIQSWPVNNEGVKTIIPFADLEKSMQMDL